MTNYRTKDGDMIDAIAHQHYGRSDVTPLVYQANPGLAAIGPILPKGMIVTLPDIKTTPVHYPVRLWGDDDT